MAQVKVICPECGEEIVIDDTLAAVICPKCDEAVSVKKALKNIVVEEEVEEVRTRADGEIEMLPDGAKLVHIVHTAALQKYIDRAFDIARVGKYFDAVNIMDDASKQYPNVGYVWFYLAYFKGMSNIHFRNEELVSDMNAYKTYATRKEIDAFGGAFAIKEDYTAREIVLWLFKGDRWDVVIGQAESICRHSELVDIVISGGTYHIDRFWECNGIFVDHYDMLYANRAFVDAALEYSCKNHYEAIANFMLNNTAGDVRAYIKKYLEDNFNPVKNGLLNIEYPDFLPESDYKDGVLKVTRPGIHKVYFNAHYKDLPDDKKVKVLYATETVDVGSMNDWPDVEVLVWDRAEANYLVLRHYTHTLLVATERVKSLYLLQAIHYDTNCPLIYCMGKIDVPEAMFDTTRYKIPYIYDGVLYLSSKFSKYECDNVMRIANKYFGDELSSGKMTVKTNQAGCYVATCVYGSYDCPEVWTLRRYRDNTLDSTFFGRAFIKIYYAISPTMVKLFGNKKWFKSFFRKRLDKMVAKLKEKGVEDTPYNDKY